MTNIVGDEYYNSLFKIVQSFMHVICFKPANFLILMKLCTDLPKGINDRFSVGAKNFIVGNAQESHAHLTVGKNSRSACEGPRDFSDTPKCAQWPHLYKSYEATYTLKCLFLETIP